MSALPHAAPAPRLTPITERIQWRPYQTVRAQTMALCAPLEPDDYSVQSMADASPAKWHLAHTSWFFEQFVLQPHLRGYRVFHEQFDYLFNSYYQSVGPQFPRAARGLMSRPTVAQVLEYRAHVDEHVARVFERAPASEVLRLIELGLHHEQQHQELLLTDVKHLLFQTPLAPVYRPLAPPSPVSEPLAWCPFEPGVHAIGSDADAGFCFDNESPRHRVLTAPYALASRLVTNGEYGEFVRDRGYQQPTLWLSDGWALLQSQQWARPLYWSADLESEFTLGGVLPLDPHAPVCHLSYYEADAYARWFGARLPTEAEWEYAAAGRELDGNFLDSGALQPLATEAGEGPRQLFGDAWEWTASAYAPYPGYRPPPGALGEYNGKFMANQLVLRGGSCVTPRSHMRASYRNFWYPHTRWQFAGIRLAVDRPR